jgi:hypothetical protein
MKRVRNWVGVLALFGAIIANGNCAEGLKVPPAESRVEVSSSRMMLGFSALFTLALAIMLLRRQPARG